MIIIAENLSPYYVFTLWPHTKGIGFRQKLYTYYENKFEITFTDNQITKPIQYILPTYFTVVNIKILNFI